MDALLAFWPGLQVLKGDVEAAIELHEMLFQVVKVGSFIDNRRDKELCLVIIETYVVVSEAQVPA